MNDWYNLSTSKCTIRNELQIFNIGENFMVCKGNIMNINNKFK
jgi:hypothetical protein